jgi:hypothetical protein
VTRKRFSDFHVDRLMERAVILQQAGWRVVRPIYVDWFWRGYSIKMSRPG